MDLKLVLILVPDKGLGQGLDKAPEQALVEALGQNEVEVQVQVGFKALGQGAGFSPIKGLGLGLGLEDRLVANKVVSEFTGDVPPDMLLPSRAHAATASGTISAILPSVFYSTSVAESEDEFEPEFAKRLVLELAVPQVVDFFVITGAVALTFV